MHRRGGHGGASVYAFLPAPVNANIMIIFSTPHSTFHTTHGHTHTHPPTPLAHGYVHMPSAWLYIGHRCPGRFFFLPYGGGEPFPSLPGRIGFPSLKGRKRRQRSLQRHNEHRTNAISNESLTCTSQRCPSTDRQVPGSRPQAPGPRPQAPDWGPFPPLQGKGREETPPFLRGGVSPSREERFFWPGGQRGAVLLVNATLSRSLVGCLTFAAPTCAKRTHRFFRNPCFRTRGFLSACVPKGRGSWRWEGREGRGPP